VGKIRSCSYLSQQFSFLLNFHPGGDFKLMKLFEELLKRITKIQITFSAAERGGFMRFVKKHLSPGNTP